MLGSGTNCFSTFGFSGAGFQIGPGVGDRKLVAGDFHHADGGSQHTENHSVDGCTLLAVLTLEDPLVAFAMA